MRLSLFSVLVLTLSLTACGSGGGNGKSTNPGGPNVEGKPQVFQGLWLSEDDATELRTTGKLESQCEDIRKNPDTTISNFRLIYGYDVYIHIPKAGKIPQLMLGTLNVDGVLTLTEYFKKQIGVNTMNLSLNEEGLLKFDIPFKGGGTYGMDYMRSSNTEVSQYFAAQQACLKK